MLIITILLSCLFLIWSLWVDLTPLKKSSPSRTSELEKWHDDYDKAILSGGHDAASAVALADYPPSPLSFESAIKEMAYIESSIKQMQMDNRKISSMICNCKDLDFYSHA